MIDFDTWQQAVTAQLDKEGIRFDFIGGLIADYEAIVSQMDDDDSEYWELETALHMDACLHELSTMTI